MEQNNQNPLQTSHYLNQSIHSDSHKNITNIEIKEEPVKPKLLIRNSKRLSKSSDSLHEIHKDLNKFKHNPENYQSNLIKHSRLSLDDIRNESSSSDDEYYPDSMNLNDTNNNNFDTLSSKSSYSITTEANCDFEFYQSNLKIDLCTNGTKNYTTPDGNVIFISNSENKPNKTFRATPKATKKIIR